MNDENNVIDQTLRRGPRYQVEVNNSNFFQEGMSVEIAETTTGPTIAVAEVKDNKNNIVTFVGVIPDAVKVGMYLRIPPRL